MNINQISNEQLAGQRLMVGFDGTVLNRELMFFIDTLKVGGIILFADNVSTPEQIKNLCLSVQEYARSCGQPKLFIAIDQEGGQVARLKEPFTQFPGGNPNMKDTQDAESFARITASELVETGINMNLAPVLDVGLKDKTGVMGGRAFGHDPIRVSELGITVIDHLQRNGVMSVAKHFPGIGRTTLDSHIDMPSLDIDFATLAATDLLPFAAAIKHNVAGIMLSHILYNKIDPEWPASLSRSIAEDLLRRRMEFGGIVMTDDLDMGAIQKRYDFQTVIRQILLADIDIALICHQGPKIETAFGEIRYALDHSQRLKIKGTESVKRIMNMKRKYIGM